MTAFSPAWLHWNETQMLIKAFGATPLRFVGGCVRDALLAREVKDVDAATPLMPQQVMFELTRAGIKVIPTGIDHGTVTAVINGKQFEITTLRRDVSTDGRRAVVAYTEDWAEDAARRDFTMNALYCDASGQIYDYFSGEKDAKEGRVRFIGAAKERIAEDALRILRFFRFCATHEKGPVDGEGLSACAEARAQIDTLSGERIEMEMMKLLAAARAGDLVELMQRYNVWEHVVAHTVEVSALKRLPALLDKTGHAPNAELSLALLLRSTGTSAALIESIAGRWKLSRAKYRHLQILCENMQVIGMEKEEKKKIRALGKELFIEHALLLMAEGADESAGLAAVTRAKNWQVPQFPVTGNDLLMRGIAADKQLGILLGQLEAYWEESGYTATKEELLNQVS